MQSPGASHSEDAPYPIPPGVKPRRLPAAGLFAARGLYLAGAYLSLLAGTLLTGRPATLCAIAYRRRHRCRLSAAWVLWWDRALSRVDGPGHCQRQARRWGR